MFNPYRGAIGIFSVLFLLAGCQMLDGYINVDSTNASDCASLCWSGIQPGVSNRAEVEQILSDMGIDYEVTTTVLEGDTYRWVSQVPVLTEGLDDEPINVSVTFSENGIVAQVGFVPTNICSRQIVDWFGIPPVVLRYENNLHIDLVYPEEGLIFLINLYTSENIGGIFFRTPGAASNWVEQAGDDDHTTWDEVQLLLTESCPDAVEHECPFSCP